MERPAGEFWCPCCLMMRDFIVAGDGSPLNPQVPLECWTCGYIYDKVIQELEDDLITHRTEPKITNAIPKQAREEARQKLREDFQRSILKQGFRRENFTKRLVRRDNQG